MILRHVNEGREVACQGCDCDNCHNCLLLIWQANAIRQMLMDAWWVFQTEVN